MHIIFFVVKNNIGDYMEKKEYKKIVESNSPKEDKLKNAVIAFLVGGVIGIIACSLTDLYKMLFDITDKDASVYMLLTLIILACLFTSLGFFDRLVSFAKCGLIIPITGFAHSVASSGLDYKKEGPIYGIGCNLLKLAGPVIVYGICAAVIFGSIRYLGGLL